MKITINEFDSMLQILVNDALNPNHAFTDNRNISTDDITYLLGIAMQRQDMLSKTLTPSTSVKMLERLCKELEGWMGWALHADHRKRVIAALRKRRERSGLTHFQQHNGSQMDLLDGDKVTDDGGSKGV